MGRIAQLSDHVANQIAAGEVVERPAAVVKELMENALDAGATQIEVEFRAGGKRYMRVTDDGCGMDREDAVKALSRHATSKLRETADLLRLGSFGFRGEALPSIASVSRFTLRTRETGATVGTEVLCEGLGSIEVKDSGGPPGTTVEVARLFHSVPARRKFLKTDRTEAAHITQLCRLFAVAHPGVGFTLIEDGNLRFRSPGGSDLEQRVREIFGRQLAGDLMPLEAVGGEDSGGIGVSGLIGKPGTGRATRAELFTFVNRRPVDSRVLNYALIESFHTYIPKGRYPISFLFVEVPPQAVDVNVHPAKREVRFRDDGRVRQVVMEAILATLREASEGVLRRAQTVEGSRPLPPPSRFASASDLARPLAAPRPVAAPSPAPPPPTHQPLPSKSESPAPLPPSSPPAPTPAPTTSPAPSPLSTPIPAPSSPRRLDWRFLGLGAQGLALFATADGFVCLHGGAARRRIVYERVLGELERSEAASQALLFPVSLELDPVVSELLEGNLPFFERLGFELEPFGRHFFRMRAAPSWFEPEAAAEFVRDLLGMVRERGLRAQWSAAAREAVALLATRKLVRRENPLDAEEAPALARQLLACRNPLADPQGKPTFFEVRRSEWAKRLGLDD